MGRMTIILNSAEKNALIKLAEREYRDPRAQAGLLVRQSLERLGLLQPESAPNSQKKINNDHD